MNVLYSLKGIVEKRRPRQGCADIVKAEMSHVLLQFPVLCLPQEIEKGKEPTENELSKTADELVRCIKETGLIASAAYAPYSLRNTKRADVNERLENFVRLCLDICVQAGVKSLVVRPLFAGIASECLWEENQKFYLSLADKAKENGIKILLENQCKDIGGHLVRGICSDPSEAKEWVDKLNEKAGENCFGFCLNVGAANLCGQNTYEMIKILGPCLEAVVLSDGDGHTESALLPFSCANNGVSRTDWLGLLRGLREIDFDGDLILDFSDTAAAFSPILRPQLLQLAKAVGDYFEWQIKLEQLLKKYPKRVLFGAGNMCRNYMKCYGETYPPMFTCDNNQKLWGTMFEGIEVKAPQELKDLPADCVIFICNIYYREIEKQLRDMGIKNPIEFFNDEYMPSFYFDRI